MGGPPDRRPGPPVRKVKKKQTARLLKAQCPECDYIVRVTRKHLAEKGAPVCPIHRVQFIAEGVEYGNSDSQDR
jgi:hypothetical protein